MANIWCFDPDDSDDSLEFEWNPKAIKKENWGAVRAREAAGEKSPPLDQESGARYRLDAVSFAQSGMEDFGNGAVIVTRRNIQEEENWDDVPEDKGAEEIPRLGKGPEYEWEKYSTGIGKKLLLRMGYKPGKGLGRDLQGILCPLEANMRSGRGAIGAYGPEY